MSKKLLEKHPSHKEFIVKTEIISRYALKALVIAVTLALVLYQALYALTFFGLSSYQEYKQDQQQKKQQEALEKMQDNKKK
jgi:hypothetical protein